MGAFLGYSGTGIEIMPMIDNLKHWQPDRIDIFQDGGINFASLELFTAPECNLTTQPYHYKEFVIVANCRIDNRDELAGLLNLQLTRPIADIEYIAFAFERWGTDCVKYLYGDFTFAIWDKNKKKLFAARDHIGIKTLYYTIIDGEIVFSTEIKGIIHYPFFRAGHNEHFFIKSMSVSGSPVTETPYENVFLLPAGHFLEWENTQLTITKYWELGDNIINIPATEAEQVKQFRQLLFEAVRCRLRSAGKIGAEVSGGLDSTGIAAIAMEILGKGSEFHSFCFGKPGKSSPGDDQKDDTDIVKEFCEKYGIAQYLKVVNDEDTSFLERCKLLENLYDHYESNGVPLLTSSFLPQAQAKNVRVMLSGHGGDHLVTSLTTIFYIQCSYKREYKRLWKHIRANNNTLMSVLRFTKNFIRGLEGKKFLRENIKINRTKLKKLGLKTEFITKYNLNNLPAERYNLHSQTNRHDRYKQTIYSADLQKRAFHHDLTGLHYNMEYRFPLLDVRLLEYMYCLPEQTIAPKGKSRYMFTEAVKAYIPAAVIKAYKSTVPTSPFGLSLRDKDAKPVTEGIDAILTGSDFKKYFNNGRPGDKKDLKKIKFLGLALVYNKISKLKQTYE